MSDPLYEKGKALEDIFFAERDRELIAKLKAKAAQEKAAVDLSALTGIADAAVLGRVAALGVDPSTLAAFSLVPLLAVAWADKALDQAERAAILVEADAAGVRVGTVAYTVLAGWLHRDPDDGLVEAWKAFHTALAPHLAAADKAALRTELVEKAKRVARASGGVFGLGAVNQAEAAAIATLEALLA